MRSGGDRLGDIAGITDTAVRDQRHTGLGQRLGYIRHRRDLRHTDAGDHTRGADRTGADAHLDAVRAAVDQRLGRRRSRDVAADDLRLRVVALYPFHAREHAPGMAMGGIDDDDVHAGFDQRLGTLFGALANADRRADPQPAETVLAGIRMLGGLLDVLDRDQAAQLEILVDHQHALEPMLVHELHRLFPGGALAHRHQALARRHDVLDRLVELGLESEIAVGDDAHDLARGADDRQARNLVLIGDVQHVAHRHVLRDRDRVLDHAAFEALDLGHFGRLSLRRHILVDDADAAFLGDRNRQARLGHGVHGRRCHGNVQRDVAGEPGFEADFAREDGRVGGNEQDIVEGKGFLHHTHAFDPSQRPHYTQQSVNRKSSRALISPAIDGFT